jgi:putative effector of murein hydrolase LrgA (UPF0299 family)
MTDVLSLLVSVVVMLAVVGLCMRWAVREQRRRNSREEGHARHH